MTDKTKIILKILAAIVITAVYFYAAAFVGNVAAFASLNLSMYIADEINVSAWVLMYIPPVLIFIFADCLLFKPLCRLFKRPIWVYTVLSGNFMTLYYIFAMIDATASSGERYSGFSEIAAMLTIAPVVSLLCGVLFCFLIQLFKSRKAKGISDSESAKEYAK